MRAFLFSFFSLIFFHSFAAALPDTPIVDVYKHEIVLEESPFPLRLFLFFAKEHRKTFEQTKQALFDKIYNDPAVEIHLALQKKKFNTLIRRKLLKELQNDFKQENDLRQVQLTKQQPSKTLLPGYFLLVDFDGALSKKFNLAPYNEKPIAVFLGSNGKILAQFDSDQIVECLTWLDSQEKADIEGKK